MSRSFFSPSSLIASAAWVSSGGIEGGFYLLRGAGEETDRAGGPWRPACSAGLDLSKVVEIGWMDPHAIRSPKLRSGPRIDPVAGPGSVAAADMHRHLLPAGHGATVHGPAAGLDRPRRGPAHERHPVRPVAFPGPRPHGGRAERGRSAPVRGGAAREQRALPADRRGEPRGHLRPAGGALRL